MSDQTRPPKTNLDSLHIIFFFLSLYFHLSLSNIALFRSYIVHLVRCTWFSSHSWIVILLFYGNFIVTGIQLPKNFMCVWVCFSWIRQLSQFVLGIFVFWGAKLSSAMTTTKCSILIDTRTYIHMHTLNEYAKNKIVHRTIVV